MAGSVGVGWMFAVVMIAVAAYHCARLIVAKMTRRRLELDLDGTHAAMAVAMTIMLVNPMAPVLNRDLACAFAVPTLWFGWRSLRSYVLGGVHAIGHDVQQSVICATMVYMLLIAMPANDSVESTESMAGMVMASGPGSTGGTLVRAVGGLLVVAMAGVAGWTAIRLRRSYCHRSRTADAASLAPALTASCQLAMSSTTVFMLTLMI